jgi:hypothetical protein
MSHFMAIVITDLVDSPSSTEIESAVEDLLEPYNENTEVDEYKTSCSCSRWNLTNAVREALLKEGLSIGQLQDELAERIKNGELGRLPNYEKDPEGWDDFFKRRETLWKEMSKSYFEREEALSKMLKEEFFKPDPECEDCHGSGKYMTTYNPNSKWDWWVIGGRWDGVIRSLESIDDGIGGFNFGPEYHMLERNTIVLRDIEDVTPYTIITPDGKWHARGEMGWFGMSSHDKDDWEDVVKEIYELYSENIAVGVDCHI